MAMENLAPYIGYFASLLLMIGLLVTTDLKFRIWNGLGCLFFIFYALIIKAPPVLLTNTVLLAINLVYFIKILNKKELFDTANVKADDVLLKKFLQFYKDDIAAYFPEFTEKDLENNINLIVLRDLVIANVLSVQKDAGGRAKVELNYTIPKFRDFKVGKYLFTQNKKLLLDAGITEVYYSSVHKKSHDVFLQRSGFIKSGGGNERLLRLI